MVGCTVGQDGRGDRAEQTFGVLECLGMPDRGAASPDICPVRVNLTQSASS
jgi:hypothetical protein